MRGPPSYLTGEEENELELFLPTRLYVIQAGGDHSGTGNSHSEGIGQSGDPGWWRLFLRRHGNITLRTADPQELYAQSRRLLFIMTSCNP